MSIRQERTSQEAGAEASRASEPEFRDLVSRVAVSWLSLARKACFYICAVIAILEVDGEAVERLAWPKGVELRKRGRT